MTTKKRVAKKSATKHKAHHKGATYCLACGVEVQDKKSTHCLSCGHSLDVTEASTGA